MQTSNRKEEKLYRVFLTRHYIEVDYVELKSTSEKKARRKAETFMRKFRPDVRATATDNGWHSDDPVEIKHVGQFGKDGKGRHSMLELSNGIHICHD
jgi:hypothetical protein